MIAGWGGPSGFGAAACGAPSLIPKCSEKILSISLSSTLNRAPGAAAAAAGAAGGVGACAGAPCPGMKAGGLIFNLDGEPP